MEALTLKVEELEDVTANNDGMAKGFETGAIIYEGPMLSEVRAHCYNPHTMLELGVKKFGEVFPVGDVEGPRPYLDAVLGEVFR